MSALKTHYHSSLMRKTIFHSLEFTPLGLAVKLWRTGKPVRFRRPDCFKPQDIPKESRFVGERYFH